MSKNKTQPSEASVADYLAGVMPEQKRLDCQTVHDAMRKISGIDAKIWGGSIVGFGRYNYKYDSGREGDFFRLGFAPRKQSITIYIMPGFAIFEDLMSGLGRYKNSVSCLYIKRLSDIDLAVLHDLMQSAFDEMQKRYPD